MKAIHLKSPNMKRVIYGIVVLLFAFIVYRIILISRLLPNIIYEGLVDSSTKLDDAKPVTWTDNSVKISAMIDETQKKIKIVEKNGAGHKDKLASMNTKIDFINKELDKKLKS